MVRCAPKPRFEAAAACRLAVMKGAAGLVALRFVWIDEIR